MLHRNAPVRVLTADGEPLRNVASVASGEGESFAILDDGSVMTWGVTNCSAGLGAREPFPVPFTKLTKPIVQISADADIVLFLASDGEVLTCGSHVNGWTPVRVGNFGPGSGIVQVAVSRAGRMMLRNDGTVFMWGRNLNWLLDAIGARPNENITVPTPVPVPEGPPVVAIAHHGACHAHAVRADGSALGWGCNWSGQVGVGNTDSGISTATPVVMPDGVVGVAAAVSSWNGMMLVRAPDATLPGTPIPQPALPVLSLEDISVDEGSSSGFPLTLDRPSDQPVTVAYRLVEGTADGDDVELGGGTVTIPAGATEAQVPVTVIADGLHEPEESFSAVIEEVTGANRTERSATAVIIDGDTAPTATISGPAEVVEGSFGAVDVALTIELSAPSAYDVRVGYTPVSGTAEVPDDVHVGGGDAYFPAGVTRVVVHAAVVGDTELESHETFGLRLTDGDHVAVDPAPHMVTILDDEPVVVDVAAPRTWEGDLGTTDAVVTAVARGVPEGGTVEIELATADGTATAGTDYQAASRQLTLTAGNPSGVLIVPVIGDTTPEIDETYRVVVRNPTAGDGRPVTLGDTAPGIVLDDDTEPGEEPAVGKFLPPVTNPPKVNERANADRSIPLKWTLGGDFGLDLVEDGYPRSFPIECDTLSAIGPARPAESTSRDRITYDQQSKEYRFVWRTDPAWSGTCRTVELKLVDGTLYTARFLFR